MSLELPTKDEVTKRSALMSRALADAARKARFSSRSRRGFDAGGFQARRGTRVMRLFARGTFALFVVVPTVLAALYYGLVASDQYVAEAQFTVIGGEIQSGGDTFGAATGIPVMAILQDTQIVTNYIESRAAVEALNARHDLRKIYGDDRIDYLSRFDRDDPVERLVRYWKSMTKTAIKMPSGIVEFKVRAFSPQDAQALGQTVIDLSERLINDLNARMQADAVSNAEAELKRAAERLASTRTRLEQARNDEGMLDAARTAQGIEKLLNEVRSAALTMQQEYQAQLRSIRETSPQMKAMRARIDAARAQIRELEAKLTATKAGSEKTVSASMTRFSALELERQIAERLYAGTAATLELARIIAEQKMMYLKTFVLPVTPEEPQYPKRLLYTFLIFGGGLALWGACLGLVTLARNNMA